MNSPVRYNATQSRLTFLALLFAFIFIALTVNALAATPLTLTSLTPATGPLTGGNTITLNGTGFTANTSVWIWANQAPVTKLASANQLTVTVPAKSSAGAVDVVVVDSGAQYRLPTSYTYSAAKTVAQLNVSTSSIGFASTSVGSSATQAVTLTASGTAPVTISAGAITGAGFSSTGVTFPLSLTPGQQATLQVKFAPMSTGVASGKISLTSNSASSSTATVSLAGTGAAAALALSSCGDITVSGTYVLTANVSSQGTCFFIDADNVVLNLNGHTITYGTVAAPLPTPGIVLADNWFNGLQQSGSTSNHGGFVVFGPGTIQDGPKDATIHNAGIWVGESNDISPAPVVHDLTIITNGAKANTIYATSSLSGWQIYNNTLSMKNSVALTLSDRSAFLGQAILISDPEQATGVSPDLIHDNHILAATQGGIRTTHQNAHIYNNDITFNSATSNDFCIDVPANGQEVDHNTCHPLSGRGIHMNASTLYVHDNIISVIELKQNVEYNGCELGGTYGMQLEFDVFQGVPPTGTKIDNNTVTAAAGDCDGIGMRMTGLSTTGSAAYTGNTVTTSNKSGIGHDYSLSFDDVEEGENMVTYTGNTFQSQYAYLTVAWDGASITIPSGQTWEGAPTYVVDDQNGYNDPADGGPTFIQSISIQDFITGKVNCGASAAGVVSIGGVNTQCN